MQGRRDNPLHRRIQRGDGEDHRLPELHLDYAFLKRDASDELLKILVVKFRPSRAARVYAAPAKGVGDEMVVDRVHKGMVEAGLRAPCIVKSDGEAAQLAAADLLPLGGREVPR